MHKRNEKGFTIVELLIVIVVIAILAAISIVAYNGIQRSARDSIRTADIKQLQKAIEMYRLESSSDQYPSLGSDNTGYALSGLLPFVNKYTGSIPVDPSGSGLYAYVRGTGGKSYGIRMSYESKPACTMNTNSATNWWSLQPC